MRYYEIVVMTEGSEQLASLVKNPMGAIQVEDLLMDSLRDLLKDEIKRYIKKILEEDPKLKDKIRETIGELMQAKLLETYAMLTSGKMWRRARHGHGPHGPQKADR